MKPQLPKLIVNQKYNTIYETEPQWRTIKYRYPRHDTQYQYHYLFFPYMQFMFIQHEFPGYDTDFFVFASQKPYPEYSLVFDPNFKISCLGDYWIVKDHSHQENINQYWNSTFVINNAASFNTFMYLSNLHKNNLYNQDTNVSLLHQPNRSQTMKLITHNTENCFHKNESVIIENHIYETPPQWRTVSIISPCSKQKYHLFFPYMQFHFRSTVNYTSFYIFASKNPYPSPDINLPTPFKDSCLGDYEPHYSTHQETITRYWNTTFVFYSQPNLITFIALTHLHKNNLWNIPHAYNRTTHNSTRIT